MIFSLKLGQFVIPGLWLIATVAGISCLHKYSGTPAPSGPSKGQWPSGSKMLPGANISTFILFLHPHCPCSGASLASMIDIIDKFPLAAKYHAVFVRPKGVAATWEKSDLYLKCMGIKAIETSIDDGGEEAKKFGALASGQTYIYSPQQKLTFSGGITPGRGEEGSGPERKMVEQALMQSTTSTNYSPTFGCSLN